MSGLSTESLVYNGLVIRDRNQMLCLTDMWKAAGSPETARPTDWLVQDGTRAFVGYIVGHLNASQDGIIQTERGRYGGTWAHWQVGMAYAQYLSPQFHAWCNSVVRSHMEGRLAPVAGYVAQADFNQFAGQVVSAITSMQEHFDAYQTETRSRFDLLGEQLAQTTRPRKEINAKVKGIIANATAHLGGYCPCCSRVKIVDENGRKITDAEYDHFYSNQHPDADKVWLICKPCHDGLTYNRVNRFEVEAHFRSFQMRRQNLGKQY